MKYFNFLALFVILSNLVFSADYMLDKSHSSVGFSVSHMVVSRTKGSFQDFTGSLSLDKNNKLASLSGTVVVTSIDTANKKRDDHLVSPDFFDATQFPLMKFNSKKIFQKGDKVVVEGEFEIHGVTKPATLSGRIRGPIQGPWGNTRIGLSLNGEIDRKSYGMTWNKMMDQGGLVVGNEVEIQLEIEGIQKK